MQVDYSDPIYHESLLEFKDKFNYSLEKLNTLIADLKDDARYYDSLNSIYLIMNSFKGYGDFLKIDSLYIATKTCEEVCSILKSKKPPIKDEMVDWFFIIYDAMIEWENELRVGNYDLTPLDSYSLNMIKISSVSTEKCSDILKTLTVLVVEPNETLLKKISTFLQKRTKKVFTAKEPQNVINSIDKFHPDIVVTDTVFESYDIADFLATLKKKYIRIPFISIINDDDRELIKKLVLASSDGFIHKPIDAKSFIEKLEDIADTYFQTKLIKLSDKNIQQFVDQLKPLNQTIQEVRRIGMERESTTKDMNDAIKKDPILSAKVLKIANSPLYGFRSKIESLQHAVSMLGKDRIAALVVQDAFKEEFKEMDISPYNITPKMFYETATKRMQLMTFWFSKVSISLLPLLSTSALLGNIGMAVIAQEIKRRNLSSEFKEIIEQTLNHHAAESEVFMTSTEEVSADVMSHWGLDHSLVQSVRFSYDIANAPGEIKQLCIANYVVYNTIPSIDPRVRQDLIEEMGDFLGEMNFDVQPYKAAVLKLLEIEAKKSK